jgi:hypothetical protein
MIAHAKRCNQVESRLAPAFFTMQPLRELLVNCGGVMSNNSGTRVFDSSVIDSQLLNKINYLHNTLNFPILHALRKFQRNTSQMPDQTNSSPQSPAG